MRLGNGSCVASVVFMNMGVALLCARPDCTSAPAMHWQPAEDAALLDAISLHSRCEAASDARGNPKLRIDWPAVVEQMGMPNERGSLQRCRRRWRMLDPQNNAAVEWLLADLEGIEPKAAETLPSPAPTVAAGLSIKIVRSVAGHHSKRATTFEFASTNLGSCRSSFSFNKPVRRGRRPVARSLVTAFDAAAALI